MAFYSGGITYKLNDALQDFGGGQRLKIRQRDDYLFKSIEYTANQTATEFLTAPDVGNKIIVKGAAIQADANSGIVVVNGTVGGETIIIAKLYASRYTQLCQTGISVPLDENTNITVTSTTGDNNVLVKMNYVIDNA